MLELETARVEIEEHSIGSRALSDDEVTHIALVRDYIAALIGFLTVVAPETAVP